ncbi:hypothetical protein RA280_39730 [Cupriavidus sp. CV2]|uniref:hypothetical protein n=1 Tax=Cupriavidus ulmosensis TaxID=3065913 RepID=UPI00296B3DD6|nr:hypothetical protein [Cupriavidus sp. CV2]MDW3687764.1 hypothetical protein [Cupriavidus sp. CV2]
MNAVESVIQAVLYEGYMLYPYRPSSVKNRQRWTFGGVYPRAYAEAQGSDPWTMQVECLVGGGPDTCVGVRPGFLQVVDRVVLALPATSADVPLAGEPAWRAVPMLDVDERRFHPWQEAVERQPAIAPARLGELLGAARASPFAFDGGSELEGLTDHHGHIRGALRRTHADLQGSVEISAAPVAEGVYRLTVRIANLTPLANAASLTRDAASLHALVSCHCVLHVSGGALVSSMDPPPELALEMAACRNVGAWPVLVGEQGQQHTMLASPIILYDYPQIAPESAGDLFDATEIDEILTLRILAMTDDEKREMAATDERTRALLARTEALGAEQMQKLHGAMRHIRAGEGEDAIAPAAGPSPWAGLDAGPRLACLRVAGREIRVGDHVRLHPRSRADIFDIALSGQVATIESIERDFEDRVHVAVTVDCDPGKDLGLARMPGHRFFFGPDEIEPLGGQQGQP